MKHTVLLLFCLFAAVLRAQAPEPPKYTVTTDANRRVATALRVGEGPDLDGDLSDACWKQAQVMTDFVTNSPVFGLPSAEKTEVRVLYTDEAVYIGAYLYMQDASKIRTDLSRRDDLGTADQFHVGLDTYRDRQNAFRFEVSAAGVQRDLRMGPNSLDVSWDAVWDARVKINADGWCVEMYIPFSAIRFPTSDEQTWGLQFARQVQSSNEFSSFSPVDPTGPGAMPQWADLNGFKNIKPPLRLAFSPYVAGVLQRSPISNDPPEFADSRSFNGGMDVKWGLSESFTLDATLVPNFGEALSDNTIRNLSPFEVFYEERRQFFTEGTELFNKGEIFYSRRIGGTPPGFYNVAGQLGENEVVVKNPSQTPLYNATKISGRTQSKLGIGWLNAVARSTEAVIRNEETGEERTVSTGELTNYNVMVFDQVLKNNSAVTFTNTNVMRSGPGRDANVSALSWNLRDKANLYEFSGVGRLSQVYNPGQDPVYGGWYHLNVGKISGKWGGNVILAGVDDQYDQRDLAINRRTNFFVQYGRVSYADFTQKGKTLHRYAEMWVENTFLNVPRQWESVEVSAYGETRFQNQMLFRLFASTRPVWHWDYYEPRVWGKKLHRPSWGLLEPGFTTDVRKRLFCSVNLTFAESPIKNDPYFGIRVAPTWVAGNHLRLSGSFRLSKDHNNFGAVDWSNPDDIIIGRRNVITFDNQLLTELLINPRMNFTLRTRYYWNQLVYREYMHLQDDGSWTHADYAGSADENFNLFNLDFVYTWQFAPGSFLNIIWKDAIFVGDNIRADRFADNWNKTFSAPQDNSVTVKVIYWLDAGRMLSGKRIT